MSNENENKNDQDQDQINGSDQDQVSEVNSQEELELNLDPPEPPKTLPEVGSPEEDFSLDQFLVEKKEPAPRKPRVSSTAGDMPSTVSIPSKDYANEKAQAMIADKNYEEWHKRLMAILKEFAPNITDGNYIIYFNKDLVSTHLNVADHATLPFDLFWDEDSKQWYYLEAIPGDTTYHIYEDGTKVKCEVKG